MTKNEKTAIKKLEFLGGEKISKSTIAVPLKEKFSAQDANLLIDSLNLKIEQTQLDETAAEIVLNIGSEVDSKIGKFLIVDSINGIKNGSASKKLIDDFNKTDTVFISAKTILMQGVVFNRKTAGDFYDQIILEV
jgi:hypothetical protein